MIDIEHLSYQLLFLSHSSMYLVFFIEIMKTSKKITLTPKYTKFILTVFQILLSAYSARCTLPVQLLPFHVLIRVQSGYSHGSKNVSVQGFTATYYVILRKIRAFVPAFFN